jgi:hypothetical protein
MWLYLVEALKSGDFRGFGHLLNWLHQRAKGRFSRIVTGSANSVYQKHAYMNVNPTPKISLANQAT